MDTSKSGCAKIKNGDIKVAMYCRVGRAEQVDEKARRIEKYSRALQKCNKAKSSLSEYFSKRARINS